MSGPYLSATALALSASLACGPAPADPALAPPVPYEDEGACPFEGCVYRDWSARENVDVRQERDMSSPVVFRVAAGEAVSAVTGVVVTVRAGEFQVRRAYEMAAADGGISLTAGQIVHLLTYEGEGAYTVWVNGGIHRGADVSGILSGACRPPDGCPGEVVSTPQTIWWVQVRNAAGATGWTDRADSFDGKDRLQ